MKVLVTGGTGFVGSHLAETLLKQGDEVFCLVRKQSNLRWLSNLKVNYIYGEMADKDSLIEAVKSKDIIYNVAGVIKSPNRAEYEKGNYIATKNLIEATFQHNRNLSRFVHISSLAVVGPCAGNICHTEDAKPCPITDYGQTKLKGELEVTKYRDFMPITIIRPPVVYGPRDTGLYFYFQAVSIGVKPVFSKTKHVSLIHIDDLARGIISAAASQKSKGGIYFIANEEPVKTNYLANLTEQAIGKKAKTLYLSDRFLSAAATVCEAVCAFSGETPIFNRQKARELAQMLWGCSAEKAYRDFGFKASIPLEEGFRKTALWYKENGWI
ncbi:MAG: NAD-dependent epimerase/dehydratase family protein [Planctomycetes bacterium]|nr:NAD-dependent epimerase/dehydratase family protein [Planctomycetota bacterium]